MAVHPFKYTQRMKKIFLFIIALSFCIIARSQSYEFTSHIKVDYEMYLNFAGVQKYKATLYAGKSSSLFTNQWIQGQDDQEKNNTDQTLDHTPKLNIRDTTTYRIFTVSDSLYSLKKRLSDKQRYYLKEQKPQFRWVMTNKTKMIENIKCHLATVTFRGRDYRAWYAPSIPIKYGPYKFSGLPGLILEIKDTENEVIFKAKKINYQTETLKESFNPSYDILSMDAYLDLRKQRSINLQSKLKKIQSRMPKGTRMRIGNLKFKDIERNFDEVTKK